jgi:hypothetical protein
LLLSVVRGRTESMNTAFLSEAASKPGGDLNCLGEVLVDVTAPRVEGPYAVGGGAKESYQ